MTSSTIGTIDRGFGSQQECAKKAKRLAGVVILDFPFFLLITNNVMNVIIAAIVVEYPRVLSLRFLTYQLIRKVKLT